MKSEAYRHALRASSDWDGFLLKESGLPGPRANLELVQAVADEGDSALFERYLAILPKRAPTNSREVFLVVCGVVGFGRMLAEGDAERLVVLRRCANDPRWRVREGVALALQCWGDVDMTALVKAMRDWAKGSLLERRAAVAAVCEPRLLKEPRHARQTLKLLDTITASLRREPDRRCDDFRTLRQTLGYGWSVATVALPDEGKLLMEKWCVSKDEDLLWIMHENLKKERLRRLDAAWVKKMAATK